MPVRIGIGSIGNAIEKGIKAESKIDYGPIRDLGIQSVINNSIVADYSVQATKPNAFIMGIHKWGSLSNKVTN